MKRRFELDGISKLQERMERVWMEELEGRVMLSRADWLDLSHVERRSGEGTPSFQFEAKKGEDYLFINFGGAWLSLDSEEETDIDFSDGDGSGYIERLSWRAPKSGTYTLVVNSVEDWDEEYELVARVARDDFGNNRANAALLRPGETINGEIEDVIDKDVFSFTANAGERWAFDFETDADLDPTILSDQARDLFDCHDGCEPMPYTGTYYVVLSGDGYEMGKYKLSARRVMDNEGGAGSPQPLPLGAAAAGSVDFADDTDWFTLDAQAGVKYVFNIRGSANKSLDIRTSADAECDTCPIWWGGRRNVWTAPADGTYYLELGGSVGEYALDSGIEKPWDQSAAAALEAGVVASGAIQTPGDVQWFVIHTRARATYTVTGDAAAFTDGLLIDFIQGEGATRDDPQQWDIAIGAHDTGNQWSWTPLHDATYYLRVHSYDPLESGGFELNVSAEEDDFGNSAAQATATELGVAREGKVQYDNDSDWFGVDVVEGEKYVFNLDSFGSYDSYTMGRRRRQHYFPHDITLALVDGDGNELTYRQNYTAFDVKLEWTATFSGPLYAQVWAQGDTPPYRLLVTKQEDDPAKALPLKIGEAASGLLAKMGDVARYKVLLEPGKVYATTLDADVAQGGWWFVPAGGAGEGRLTAEWAGYNTYTWQVQQPTEVFVEVDARDATTYAVLVSEYVPPPPPVEEETPPVVAEPAAPPAVVEAPRNGLAGELADEEDVRAFSFSAAAGKTYTFQTILGSLEDSTLTIYDAEGNFVDENDDVSDDDLSSMLEWTAQTSGTYYIVVGGFGGGRLN
jgi:hypothetical protein